jgi:hypothetical protein
MIPNYRQTTKCLQMLTVGFRAFLCPRCYQIYYIDDDDGEAKQKT